MKKSFPVFGNGNGRPVSREWPGTGIPAHSFMTLFRAVTYLWTKALSTSLARTQTWLSFHSMRKKKLGKNLVPQLPPSPSEAVCSVVCWKNMKNINKEKYEIKKLKIQNTKYEEEKIGQQSSAPTPPLPPSEAVCPAVCRRNMKNINNKNTNTKNYEIQNTKI